MNYVMFGHSSLLGEIADIINLRGGILSKIVQNIPEQPIAGRKTLAEQILALPMNESRPKDSQAPQHPVLVESIEQFMPQPNEHYIMGFTGAKQAELVRQLKNAFNINFESIIHPSVILSPTTQIGEGALILAGTIISSNVEIGNHVFINKASIIGHDAQIGDFVRLQPGVKLSGYVTVEEDATLCVGSIILENLTVGSGSTVAAGAVVISNVKHNCMVAGVPATIKKEVRAE